MSLIAKNTFISLGFNAINACTQMVLFTNISNTDFGHYALIIGYITILESFLTIPFGHVLYGNKSTEIEDQSQKIYALFWITSLIKIIIYIFIMWQFSEFFYQFFYIMLFIISANILSAYNNLNLMNIDLNGSFLFSTFVRGGIVSLSSISALIYGYIFDFGMDVLIFREVLPGFILFLFLAIKNKTINLSLKVTGNDFIIVFRDLIPYYFTLAAERLFMKTPVIVLGYFYSADKAGLFFKIFYLIGLANTILSTFHQRIFYADVSNKISKYAELEKIQNKYNYAVIIFLAIISIVSIMLFYNEFLGFKYNELAFFIMLIPIMFLQPHMNLLKSLAYSLKQSYFVLIGYVSSILIYLCLVYIYQDSEIYQFALITTMYFFAWITIKLLLRKKYNA
jgi:hypothetical protein